MTSRARVLSAFAHRQPDRIPVDLAGLGSAGIAGIAYHRLRKFLGLADKPTRIFNLPCQLAEVDYDILEAVGADALGVRMPVRGWQKDVLPDGTECLIADQWNVKTREDGSRVQMGPEGNIVLKMPAGGYYFESCARPLLAEASTARDIEQVHLGPDRFDQALLGAHARSLYEETDYFLIGDFYCSIFEKAWYFRGMPEFLMDMATDARMTDCLLDKVLEREMRSIGPQLESCKGFIQAMTTSDDLGMQHGLMLSPGAYRRFIKPRQKRLYEFMKSICDIPLILHSCGNIYELIPDLIEIGVDALNPIQVACPDMADTGRLKREFGKDIVFWGGGCDTQGVLPTGTPEDIRAEVRRRIDDLSTDGGWVFCAVHNIQADTAPESIMAMYDAVRERGR